LRKILIASLLPLLFSFTVCGHRGAPKPPLSYKPKTPKLYPPIQEYKSPLVWWERVTQFEDGRKIPQPQKVEYKVVINFGKRVVKTKEPYYKDFPIEAGQRRCYSVAAIYNGKEGEPSEPTCITGKEPIEERPVVKRLLEEDSLVEIEIEPSREYSVEIFKNQTEEPFVKPYATLKPGESLFKDNNVKNDVTYTYLLRFAKDELKGPFTEPITATPKDKTPPLPPPSALLVLGEPCVLLWEPSPSEDVIGYKVVADGEEIFTSGIYLTFKKCPERVTLYAVDKGKNLSKPVTPEVVDEEGGSGNGE